MMKIEIKKSKNRYLLTNEQGLQNYTEDDLKAMYKAGYRFYVDGKNSNVKDMVQIKKRE